MKYLLPLILLLIGCTSQKEEDGFVLCEKYCNSFGEDFSKVRQMSMGTCICDNDEGKKVSLGYHLLKNNKCNIPKDWWKYQ